MKATKLLWIVLLGLISSFAGVDANQRVLACVVPVSGIECTFLHQTLLRDEMAVIESRHVNTNDNQITSVRFTDSTVFSIPSGLFLKFPNLEMLDMNGQNVHRIEPFTFQRASRLTRLDLAGNFIRKIEQDTFSGASNLSVLLIDRNQLTEITRSSFETLTSLADISLSENPITRIHKDSFENLAKLRFVNIGNSRLTFLHRDLFRNNLGVRFIELASNQIVAMSNRMFSHLAELQSLFLNNNLCIDRIWWPNQNFTEIERELVNCSRAYAEQAVIQESLEYLIERVDDLSARQNL
jgi:Leucine-rich repeat (LRR) protein